MPNSLSVNERVAWCIALFFILCAVIIACLIPSLLVRMLECSDDWSDEKDGEEEEYKCT
jgi:hypothetical protein